MSILKSIIYVVLVIGFFGLSSCATRNFTLKEHQYIHSKKDSSKVFRVLSIDNKSDSLFLRKNAIDLKAIKGNTDLALLISILKATMEAEEGIGIAAPQIGISRNVFLFKRMDDPEEKIQVVINPKIIAHSDSIVCFQRDGCLSIPDIRGNSKRYAWVKVQYYDENGKKIIETLKGYNRPNDFTNVIFQHEFDHLRGVLFIDKLCD